MITVEKPTKEKLAGLDIKSWPVWEKDISDFPWEYDESETCYLLEGDVVVTPEKGEPVRFEKGDFVVFPAGLKCRWKINKKVKKHYKFG